MSRAPPRRAPSKEWMAGKEGNKTGTDPRQRALDGALAGDNDNESRAGAVRTGIVLRQPLSWGCAHEADSATQLS
jgi:hypothetical protein